jgi:hypothetical protein
MIKILRHIAMNLINKEYLASGNGKSSMRLVMIWVTVLISLLIICTVLYLVVLIFTNPVSIDWEGITAFLGAIAGILAIVFTGKVQQKRQEVKRDISNNNPNKPIT